MAEKTLDIFSIAENLSRRLRQESVMNLHRAEGVEMLLHAMREAVNGLTAGESAGNNPESGRTEEKEKAADPV